MAEAKRKHLCVQRRRGRGHRVIEGHRRAPTLRGDADRRHGGRQPRQSVPTAAGPEPAALGQGRTVSFPLPPAPRFQPRTNRGSHVRSHTSTERTRLRARPPSAPGPAASDQGAADASPFPTAKLSCSSLCLWVSARLK